MRAGIAKTLRSYAAALVLAFAGACAIAPAAMANAIEAERSYADGRKDEAIRMFRRAAWQQNDFFAQIRLGEIYSAKRADDKGYEDRVEAFVWYFLASRNPSVMEHLHLDEPAQAIADSLAAAEREARTIYSTLLQDERADVRNRIVYIQSCLGGVGLLRAGMYYDPNIAERHELGSLQGASVSRPIIRPFQQNYAPNAQFGAPPPRAGVPAGGGNGGGAPAVLIGRWPTDLCRENPWWGWIFGDPKRCGIPDPATASSAAFAPSAIEALVFYSLAQRSRHPYAAKYIEALKLSFDTPEEGAEADRIAKGKAKRWIAPFEFYASESRERGETLSGLVHSDECPINNAQERALSLADRTIAPAIRMDMLKFLNFHRGDGLPATVAVKKFQDFLGEPETGVLTAMQTVRLFQIAATRGYVRGQRCLGIMYLKGVGVLMDAVRAEKWLLAASNQGDGEAMYALSELYSLGADGVEKLEDKANRYRQGAAIAGFTPVKAEFLRLLETAPVRAEEQAQPAAAEQPAATEPAVERPQPRTRSERIRDERQRARELRQRQRDRERERERRRPRSQPDDGPFGE
jgi:TPR repeat protein